MKKRIFRGFFLVGVLFVFCFISFNHSGAAEKYPSHPVTLVNPGPPGGVLTLMSELYAKFIGKYLGRNVVLDYRPGAGGIVAYNYVANSKPDGYTIGHCSDGVLTAIVLGEATYSIPEDLRFIAQVYHSCNMLAVKADAPWKTFQEFMDYARKNPGVKYAHPGVGGTHFLQVEYLNSYADLKMVHIPFKGVPELTVAILGGHVPIGVGGTMAFKPLVEAGKLRVIFCFDPASESGVDPNTADFPTVFGKNTYYIQSTSHVYVSAKTPAEIVKVLEGAVEKMTKDPEYISELKKNYFTVDFVEGKIVMEKKFPEKMSHFRKILRDAGVVK